MTPDEIAAAAERGDKLDLVVSCAECGRKLLRCDGVRPHGVEASTGRVVYVAAGIPTCLEHPGQRTVTCTPHDARSARARLVAQRGREGWAR